MTAPTTRARLVRLVYAEVGEHEPIPHWWLGYLWRLEHRHAALYALMPFNVVLSWILRVYSGLRLRWTSAGRTRAELIRLDAYERGKAAGARSGYSSAFREGHREGMRDGMRAVREGLRALREEEG